jgi:peptidyl-prolyl cis-trans isomerase B (cyclophilin B)
MNGLRWVVLISILTTAAGGLSCSSKRGAQREDSTANSAQETTTEQWTGWGTPTRDSQPATASATPTTGESVSTKPASAKPVVLIETSEGNIRLELWPDKAPITVANFLRYVDEGFYNGTIFHRVIAEFMIQGGGFTMRMEEKKTHEPIRNEAGPFLRNLRGTVVMARTPHPQSATSQFFINLADNHSLNHTGNTAETYGYAVFGRVVEGIEVVDKIGRVPTTKVKRYEDVPIQPVVITRVSRVEP